MTKTGLLILATIFATGAIAQPREVQPPAQSERVAYTDLDLASRAGQRAPGAQDRACCRSNPRFVIRSKAYHHLAGRRR